MIYLPTLEVVRAAAHKAIDEHAPGSLSTASTAALSSGIGGAVASVASSAVRPNSPSFPPPPRDSMTAAQFLCIPPPLP